MTDEEVAALKPEDWSEPSSTFKTRYLLNSIAKTHPLTHKELDMLMLPANRTNRRKVDFVKREFHAVDGEHKLYAFRSKPYEYLQTNGYLQNVFVPSRYKEGSRRARARSSRKRSKRRKPEPYETSYVSSSPAYAPPTKKLSRVEVTRSKPETEPKKDKRNGKKGKGKDKDNKPPPILVEYKDKVGGPKLDIKVVRHDDDTDGSLSPQYRPSTPTAETEADEGTTNATHATTKSPQYEPTSPYSGHEPATGESATDTDASSTDSDDSGDEVSPGTCMNSVHDNTRTNTHISPEQVAKHSVNPIKIERPVRRGAIIDLLSGVMEIPDGLWCPATSRIRPVGVSYPNRKQKSAIKSSLDSEVKGSRLLQAYMEYRAPDGTIQKGRVQIDTQSNINYTLSKYALPRTRRVWKPSMR